MTAQLSSTAAMSTASVPKLHRFKLEDYHRMAAAGILTPTDRIELLEGIVVQMNPIGPQHRTSVILASRLIEPLLPQGWHLQIQQPLSFDDSEPQPDLAIVRGGVRDYPDRHPGSGDVHLIIEVADSSLAFDRDQKARIYATAKIPESWIINLDKRWIEVYNDPRSATQSEVARYTTSQIIKPDESVALRLSRRSVGGIQVADLLP